MNKTCIISVRSIGNATSITILVEELVKAAKDFALAIHTLHEDVLTLLATTSVRGLGDALQPSASQLDSVMAREASAAQEDGAYIPNCNSKPSSTGPILIR